ncbi:unnamed protein product [Arctia plantaginis]|uniref:Uncharacterized protein n=1 Tax=Arctia plantaginis TaxID=874455 RepID=A0A8S0YU86_ARCPL|nr:unnamed protein product [Arctia plantaginis]
MPKPGKKKGQKSSEAQRVEAPREPEPEPVPEEPQVEEEDEGIGSKRRLRKEKKQAKQETARQAAVALSEITPGRQKSEPPAEVPNPAPVPEEKVEVVEVAEEFEGLGLGSAKKKKPKKKKTDGPSTSASTSQSVAAPTPQPVAAPTPQSVAGPSSQSVTATPRQLGGDGNLQQMPSSVYTQGAPSTHEVLDAPVAGPSKTLTQMKPSSSFSSPPSAFVEQRQAPSGPWGRGRGRPQVKPTVPTSHSTPQFAQSHPVQPQPTSPPQPSSTLQSRPTQQKHGQYSQENVVCRYKIPTKVPGRLVGGRTIAILTNYLEMTFKSLKISRYDVSFNPDRPKKLIPLVFKKVKEKYYPRELLAFDQTKNCYSLRPLQNVPQNERFNTVMEIEDSNGRLIRFEVSFKSTGVVELDKIRRYMTEGGASVLHPTEEVQCIDVILRQGTLESYVKAGRQFFRRPKEPVDLGHGYEMWTGLFQSAIFTNKAFVNIDVAHKGFPKHQSMINAITRDFRLDLSMPIERQRTNEYENFTNFIKGLKVTATMVGASPNAGQKREYICNGLVDPPGKLKFWLNQPDGKQREISVGDYFAKEKGYHIKYPYFNCIWVGPKEKSIYFPVELLEVAYGQPLARQLNESQVSKMVREAATPPDKRLAKIKEVISSMQYSKNREFKQFGLEISDKFYEVKARILDPPLLDIGRGTTVPRRGQWQANQLLKPESLLCWGFVAVETGHNIDFDVVIDTIMSAGKQLGMNISNPTIKRFDVTMMSLSNVLRGAQDQGIRLLFVVVSTKGRDHYHRVKQMAEREVGMLTQCIKEATTRRMNGMTAKNILLKVNSKLMGINQALGDKTLPRCLREGGVMIVGADVTHPSPDQSNVPSIAAVTASIDPKCYMYNIELSVQTPKKEMIVEFEDMMFDHLKVYKERNMNHLPRKIFVFRDGVSEGQFVQVMNSELAAVHAAYQRMAGASRKPEILFLLVQKRHHTRFFNKGDYCQYNVEPGTVVDTDIVHATELDFYLVSHQALKGTARPTRYHAVCNDGKIPDDEVEQLTYYLCHLYSRCMRSVSYPTPTYYAHLACLRARSLTYGQKFNNKDLEKKPERLHVLDKMLKHSRMFFV